MNLQDDFQSEQYLMSKCTTSDECPFLYFCDEQSKCSHDSIFPLQVYPIIIYLLIPFASGLVNMTGNSMGIFKVLILMNLLRYNVAESTVFIQPMVAGTALPNFFSIIFKKHPKINSTLVDYNIVYILIPCCLLGSTLGSLIQNFIPQIVQDALVVLFFSYFAFQFWKKIKTMREVAKEGSLITEDNLNSLVQEQDELSEEVQEMKKRIQTYQASYHIPDVLRSFGVFIIFQFFVFLVQGKFKFYQIGKCSWEYGVGLVFLILLTLGYLYVIRKRLTRIFTEYKMIRYEPNIDLSEKRKFIMTCLGGLGAGLVQGILGVGSGTFIMGVLLGYNLDPRVASATSGYQIFFIGAASFIETFINGSIQIQDAALLFGVCSILGGLVTFGMYTFLKTRDSKLVNKWLVIIIFILCLISVIGVFPSTIQTYLDFGWEQLIKIKFHC